MKLLIFIAIFIVSVYCQSSEVPPPTPTPGTEPPATPAPPPPPTSRPGFIDNIREQMNKIPMFGGAISQGMEQGMNAMNQIPGVGQIQGALGNVGGMFGIGRNRRFVKGKSLRPEGKLNEKSEEETIE